ncbi:MAG: 2-oxoacid:acceptor oxidoreductase family protein [Deltaproteobacteria bacterium]|nr:2-oxoacid:acceptor oxidoreductase family protein [Deltaproteobacteria bacterium]
MSDGKTQVRLSGFGGQGIILAGEILGMAVTLHEGRNAVLTQSFGPEARGGACSADVVVSDARIYYPCVTVPDVLVLMSEEAARTYGPNAAEGALVLVNEDLVRTVPKRPDLRIHRIPATRLAEGLGRVMVANIVMLGFITARAKLVSPDAMKKALLASVPPGTEKLNENAFRAGYEYEEQLSVIGSR